MCKARNNGTYILNWLTENRNKACRCCQEQQTFTHYREPDRRPSWRVGVMRQSKVISRFKMSDHNAHTCVTKNFRGFSRDRVRLHAPSRRRFFRLFSQAIEMVFQPLPADTNMDANRGFSGRMSKWQRQRRDLCHK